jgi:restriction system protein
MSIPGFQDLMLPVLEILADGKELPVKKLTPLISDKLKLTEAERSQKMKSGSQTTILNRTAWAKKYLKEANLIDNPTRGIVKINSEGLKVLAKKPPRVDIKYLKQFPAFHEFMKRCLKKNKHSSIIAEEEEILTDTHTPDERMEAAYSELREALADDILETLTKCKPEFFEKLVVELLVAMGYGGSIEDAGKAIGKSNDGGIDGRIKEDRFGFDEIVVQAKKWDNPVSSPQIRDFIGALDGYKAKKGVFITTSTFSQPAIDAAKKSSFKIILIDGETLVNYMIDWNIGVSVAKTLAIKQIDSDYYELESDAE